MRLQVRGWDRVAAAAALVGTIAWSGIATAHAPRQDDPAQPAYFTAHVAPILQTNCGRCHIGENHRGHFNMNTRDALLAGGHDGSGVVPGHPEQSWVVRLIRHEGPADDPMPMPPPPRPKLSDADIAAITEWVKAGAVTPEGPLFSAPH